jgi:hypothetical protein
LIDTQFDGNPGGGIGISDNGSCEGCVVKRPVYGDDLAVGLPNLLNVKTTDTESTREVNRDWHQRHSKTIPADEDLEQCT